MDDFPLEIASILALGLISLTYIIVSIIIYASKE